jgi:hypothetical protein
MRKPGKLEYAAKVIALCLRPVVISLIGLAALSRKSVVRQLSRVDAPRLLGRPSDEWAPHEAFAR